MRRILLPVLCLMCFFTDCNKKSAAVPDAYYHIAANSTWNYQLINNSGPTPVTTNFVVTSTNRDTTAMGKTYHVFTNSSAGNQYYNHTGSDYYQLDSLKLAATAILLDRLYLKDEATVGTGWSQSFNLTLPGVPIPVPITVTYSIAEKGIARTVNGVAYSDVIRVSTSISSSLIPAASLTTTINSYYARKYGLIENSTVLGLNFMGFVQNVNTSTKLMSSNLK